MATIYRECEFKFKSESSWQMLRGKKREFTVGRSRAREPDRADAPPPRRPRGGPSSPPATWMLRPCALKREVTSQSDTRLAVRVPGTLLGGLSKRLRLSWNRHCHPSALAPRWKRERPVSSCAEQNVVRPGAEFLVNTLKIAWERTEIVR